MAPASAALPYSRSMPTLDVKEHLEQMSELLSRESYIENQ